jgi:hypothetical protein
MALITLLITLTGFLLVLSYLRTQQEEFRDLKKFVGTLERPMPVCKFKPYRKPGKPAGDDFQNSIQKR